MALIVHGGLNDPARIRSQGLGEADPVAPNTTAENRAQNRRVEIVLLAAPTLIPIPPEKK
jgi:type VI secretion system protein ImpK